LRIFKFGDWVFFSLRSGVAAPSFFKHVSHVVRIGSDRKMRRIAARGIVATVKNQCSTWNRPNTQNPSSAVGVNCNLANSTLNQAVTRSGFGSVPKPAFITPLHLRPESLREVFGKTLRNQILRCNCWLHSKWFLLCRALGCFSIAEVFSFRGSCYVRAVKSK